LVEQQRGQIGILKALGYTNKEITLHYMSYAIIVGVIGGLLGSFIGMAAATPMTMLLISFFNIPVAYEYFSTYHFFIGMLLSIITFLMAGYNGAKYALWLEPAEAIRPPAPESGERSIFERIGVFNDILTIQGKMALRNLVRNKGRSIFMFLGIMLSCALVAITWSFNDMVDKLLFHQYEEVETYDVKVALTEPVNRDTLIRELYNHDEVVFVESFTELPVTLTHNWLKENTIILGIEGGSNLYNVLDEKGRNIPLTSKGLILSERLADKLKVSKGSVIEIESPLIKGNKQDYEIEVYDIIPQYMGMNAYMEISGLVDIIGQGDFATGALVNVKNDEGIKILRDRYKKSDIVLGIDGREERISQAKELMEVFGSVMYMYVFIGIIIGFAIIYSSNFIVLSERSWEMASMRVLGFTTSEVFSIITFEQWFISIFAILAGLPLGQIMQYIMAIGLSTDMYTLPQLLDPESLFVAPIFTAFSIWVAQRFALRRVKKIQFVEVLKTRE
ncbi:MAG TPA: FtsX-like permease family protein, partial [Thermoanaerobacterales bacterium]|nr:FtsX-like permease family protein [Thermoanaerobacterales bacterium]